MVVSKRRRDGTGAHQAFQQVFNDRRLCGLFWHLGIALLGTRLLLCSLLRAKSRRARSSRLVWPNDHFFFL